MRTARLKIDSALHEAAYHCISRLVDDGRHLSDADKEVLRKMIWDVAEFCGIEILTYVLMINHFHIAIIVPKRTPISDEELLRRYWILHRNPSRHLQRKMERIEAQMANNGPEAVAFRKRMDRLMNDLSCFMQLLKQRYSTWFNDNHDRFGTLWAGRFKSPLNEINPIVNTAVGAYIDLNSVKAGLVVDPKDYRFCGYAEAVAGNLKARQGIIKMTGCPDWATALKRYREVLFSVGSRVNAKGFKIVAQRLKEVMENGGELSLMELLNCRVRYVTDGLILGTPDFVKKHMGWADKDLVMPRKAHLLPCDIDGTQLAIPQRMRGPVLG